MKEMLGKSSCRSPRSAVIVSGDGVRKRDAPILAYVGRGYTSNQTNRLIAVPGNA